MTTTIIPIILKCLFDALTDIALHND